MAVSQLDPENKDSNAHALRAQAKQTYSACASYELCYMPSIGSHVWTTYPVLTTSSGAGLRF